MIPHSFRTPAVIPGFLEVFWKEGFLERMEMEGTPRILASPPPPIIARQIIEPETKAPKLSSHTLGCPILVQAE